MKPTKRAAAMVEAGRVFDSAMIEPRRAWAAAWEEANRVRAEADRAFDSAMIEPDRAWNAALVKANRARAAALAKALGKKP